MTPTSDRDRPDARRLTAGLILAMGAALYASLIPFRFVSVPLREVYWQLRGLVFDPLYIWSRADFLANILMGCPVGFFAMGLLMSKRGPIASRWPFGTLLRIVVAVAFGMTFAITLELLQVFTPFRHVAQSDVIAQTTGAFLGACAWLAVGSALMDLWPVVTPDPFGSRTAAARAYTRTYIMLGLYTALWCLAMTLPLDITASPREIWAKYQAGYIVLVPFTATGGVTAAVVVGWLMTALAAIPVGAFTLHALRRRGWRPGIWVAGAAATLFVAGVEIVQILVAQRTADATDILVGGTGAVVGVWRAGHWKLDDARGGVPRPGQYGESGQAGEEAQEASDRGISRRGRPAWAAGGAVVWCLALALYHWRPFAFSFDPVLVRERIDHVSLLPLQGYAAASGVDVLAQALTKTGLGYPLGILMAALLWARRPSTRQGVRLRLVVGLVVAIGLFAVLEAGQLFLPDRVPDVTDVLLGSAGAMAGLVMTMPPLQSPGRGTQRGREDVAHRA
jgi:VanZ family protein